MDPFTGTRANCATAISLLCLLCSDGLAQCSDAGSCTISRHDEAAAAVQSHSLGVRYTLGGSGTPDDVTYHSLSAEADLRILSHSRLTVILPLNQQSGPSGTVRGVGDLIALWDQTIVEWAEGGGRLQLQAGARLGTGDANARMDLPMTYQSGLGSNDLILGVSVQGSRWSGGAALQIAGNRNNNALVRLKRGDQVLVWGSAMFSLGTTEFTPGIAVLQQLGESSIQDRSQSGGEIVPVPESDQLQVNVALRVRQKLTTLIGADLFVAMPLLAREVNVDGLKRKGVLSFGLLFNF